MRIVYDHQIFCQQVYGGISRYFCEVASRIGREAGHRATIVAPLHINRLLEQEPELDVVGQYVPYVRGTGWALQRLNAGLVRWLLRRQSPDIVHETYYREGRLSPAGARTVVTVYDMIHERFPGSFPKNDKTASQKRKAVQRADHIICISETTRRDLIELLGVEASRAEVVHLGHRLRRHNDLESRASALAPYFAFVGQRAGYKNFARLLRAFASSDRLRRSFRIACFGGGAMSPAERNQALELGLTTEDLVHVEGDDEALTSFYRNAIALVCPSLYEGFGLPPLEAMSMGCPVLCSDRGALPEVCGHGAQYFDPVDEESIRAALEAVAYSGERRDELLAAGHQRAAQFSWDRCARKTAAIYRALS